MDIHTLLKLRTRRACDWPLSLLALVDMITLNRNYAQLLSEPPAQNQWFVMRGKEALPPQSFQEVLGRLSRGEGPLLVLREADAEQTPAPWQTIAYPASASSLPIALAVAVGFWVVAVFLGWVVVAVIAPHAHQVLWERSYFIAALAFVAWLWLSSRTTPHG
jgi:hypothetical protein